MLNQITNRSQSGSFRFVLLCFLFITTLCSTRLNAQYCTSSASSTMDGDIGNVVINGVTHVSSCNTTGGGMSVLNKYSDFSNIGALTTLQSGDVVNFQVEIISCNTVNYLYGIGVYIDYNRNNSLIDAGETVYLTMLNSNQILSGNTLSASFTVPNGIATGNTLMRIVAVEGGLGSNITPCGSYVWGETEDFTVMLGNPITANIIAADCGAANGQIDITYTGGTAPYTYTWSNGATTEDLTALAPGAYSVSITDAMGAAVQNTFYVNSTSLATNASIVNPNCYANDGAITINPSGGTPPYQIQWSNGVTGTNNANLNTGGYSVNITDANGCFLHEVYNLGLATNCYVQIGGNAYYDANNNCTQDAGELGVPYTTIAVDNLNNNNYFGAITPSTSGNYLVVADTGHYTVTANLPASYMAINCANSNMYAVPMPNYGMNNLAVNFPISIPTVQDLKVTLSENAYVPGMPHQSYLHYRNAGTIATNATLTYNYSPLLHNLTFSLAPSAIDTVNHLITWNLGTLPMLSTWAVIHISSVTDTTATIGAASNSTLTIDPVATDFVPADNQANHTANVVASFDPNMKQVSPMGVTEHGLVDATNTNTFHYTVHFQNTGNFQAQYVVVKDSISADFDMNSFQFEGASHVCNVTMENERLLVFHFDNINLPYESADEPGSHGFVSFSLKTKSGVAPFTELRNKANIYFDFNAPIITNEVLNTLYLFPTLNLANVITICETDNVNSTINGGKAPYEFTWSNGNVQTNNLTGTASQVANTLPAGVNTLSVTDVYGYTISQNFNLTTVAPAVANFTQSPLSANSYQLTASNANYPSYQWNFGNGQTSSIYNPIVTYAAPGTYNVTLTVQNLCGAVSQSQTIDITTDIDNADFGVKVSAYPNPFMQELSFDFPNPTGNSFSLELSDVNGKIVEKAQSQSNHIQIATEKWASGLYFWKLSGAKSASGIVEKK